MRAELYRVDNAHDNKGERLVSNTLFVDAGDTAGDRDKSTGLNVQEGENMLQRLMNKKVIIGLLGILILLAAFGRIMTTPAEEYRFVTWEKGTNDHEVK